jgi:glycosyltransferase involved in cell wall biosynthesis
VFIKYRIPKKYFFYPAQFWEHKNHIGLLYAVKILKDQGVLVNLVLVGAKKNNFRKTINKIKELKIEDNISVLGYVSHDDMYSLYKNARALVFVSLIGPTNIPPMEALLLGCPVIVSNVYAMPEQIKGAGLLVDPYNPIDIANNMKRIWVDDVLCEELVKKGLKVVESYGQEDFNKKLEATIMDVYKNF